MATLVLDRVWMNLVASGVAVAAQSDPDRTREYNDEGEIRIYGEGRARVISSVGERGFFSFEFEGVTEDQITTLRAWKKQLVQVRDHMGRRFYGSYFSVAVGEYRGELDLYTAAISLQFATYTEGA